MNDVTSTTKSTYARIDPEPILQSLELVGERVGDPTPLVYERLFKAQPEMEALFVMDTTGAVRGHMLSEALDGIIDFIGERHYADNLILSEIVNHEGMGVPRDVFSTFYANVRDTFRDILDDEWTSGMESSWQKMLGELTKTVEQGT